MSKKNVSAAINPIPLDALDFDVYQWLADRHLIEPTDDLGVMQLCILNLLAAGPLTEDEICERMKALEFTIKQVMFMESALELWARGELMIGGVDRETGDALWGAMPKDQP